MGIYYSPLIFLLAILRTNRSFMFLFSLYLSWCTFKCCFHVRYTRLVGLFSPPACLGCTWWACNVFLGILCFIFHLWKYQHACMYVICVLYLYFAQKPPYLGCFWLGSVFILPTHILCLPHMKLVQ